MASESRRATWAALEELAAGQFGVLSVGQLRAQGLSRSAIEHAVRSGRLHRVFRGVYGLGSRQMGRYGRELAAVLACGEGAVVSHRSAAALLGLLDRGPAAVDVIARGRRGREIDGIRGHDVAPPHPWEVGTFAGVPCTSPARTLVDVAGEVGDRTLRSCFERAAAKRLLDLRAVEASLRPRRRGVLSLRAPNAPVDLVEGRIEVDFLWPERRFVVEADSRDFHGTELAFERDRWRDRELMRVGHGSLRVTRLQAEEESELIADAVARELAARSRASS